MRDPDLVRAFGLLSKLESPGLFLLYSPEDAYLAARRPAPVYGLRIFACQPGLAHRLPFMWLRPAPCGRSRFLRPAGGKSPPLLHTLLLSKRPTSTKESDSCRWLPRAELRTPPPAVSFSTSLAQPPCGRGGGGRERLPC